MKYFEREPQVPRSLLETLRANDPGRNVAFTAVEQLKDEAQIREFFGQYVEWLEGAVEEDPRAVARQNIVHIVGYYSRETAERWMRALARCQFPRLE